MLGIVYIDIIATEQPLRVDILTQSVILPYLKNEARISILATYGYSSWKMVYMHLPYMYMVNAPPTPMYMYMVHVAL